MTEIESKPFGGFTVSHPSQKFEVTGRGLRLYRRMIGRTSLSEAKPQFSTSIHGQAVADHVCAYSAPTTIQKHLLLPLILISTSKARENILRALTF